MYELVTNINGYVSIDTGGMVCVSAVGWLIGGIVNTVIKFFLGTGIGMMPFIYCIFEVLLPISVAATYDFRHCNWSLSMRIA